MAVKRYYRINLRKYGNLPVIQVSQYDEDYELVFEVFDGSLPAGNLSEYTVMLKGVRADTLAYSFTGTVSGPLNNMLSFVIDTTMTGCAGRGKAEIVLTKAQSNTKFASFNMSVFVEEAAVPDGSIDADVQRAQEVAAQVQEIVDTAAAEVKGEAESWAVGERDGEPVPSTDPTYQNNAKFYAEQAQEIADSIGIDATLSVSGKAADAKATGDEIARINEVLSDINGLTPISETFNQKHAYKTTNGLNIDIENPISTTSFDCCYIACSEGDVFTFSGNASASANYRAWCFVDSSGAQLKKASDSGTLTDVVIKAPANTAYVIFNFARSATYKVAEGEPIRSAVDGKQDALIFDDVPTEGSKNPVKSGGEFLAFEELRSAIGYAEIPIPAPIEVGYYWNAQTATAVKTELSTYKVRGPIEVEAGETYIVNTYDSTSTKTYAVLLVDDDYTILSHYGDRSGGYKDYTVVVPDGATMMLLTVPKAQIAKAYKKTIKPVPANVLNGTFEYSGKNVAIIGDSISTNGDYSESNPLGNVPELIVQDEDIGVELSAYVTYYDIGTTIGGHTIVESDVGTEITFTPVSGDEGKYIGKPKNNNVSTTDTWWEVASKTLGFNAIPVCWSGASITAHEEGVAENGHYIYKCSHAWHESQIRKCGVRIPGSMTRTAPDMIIIYRGTNDLSHSPYSLLTDDLDTSPTVYPDTDTFEESGAMKYSYVKGMRLLIKKLRDAYPEAKIVLCTLNYFRRLSTTAKYTSNGRDNWLTYNAMIRRLADHEGCELIEFDKDGLTWANAMNGYYNEGTSATAKWTHPNTLGHARLGSRALIDLRKVNEVVVS